MARRVLRGALLVVVTIALWAVARPALAMPAPYCDDRGASGVAQAPALEAPAPSGQRVLLATPVGACERFAVEVGRSVLPGRAAPAWAPSGEPVALPPAPPLGDAPAVVPPRSAAPVSAPALDGARYRVERPPRA